MRSGPEDFGRGVEADIVSGWKGLIAGKHLLEGVAAEFLGEGGGKLNEEDALKDNASAGDGAGIGAFVVGLRGGVGGEVDALLGGEGGGDRLHRGSDDEGLAGGDAAFEAAVTVGGASNLSVLQDDGVVAGATGKGGVGEGIGEGDAFDGVDREHGGAEAGVQTAVRGDVGTEADGESVNDGDNEPAEGLAFGTGEVDGVGVGVFLRLGGGAGGGVCGKVERLAERSL